jgi:hypothetical protein
MTPPDDHVLPVARRIETMLVEITCAGNRADVFDLQQRATEMISGLPRAIDRARLQERVDDAVAPRLQDRTVNFRQAPPRTPGDIF